MGLVLALSCAGAGAAQDAPPTAAAVPSAPADELLDRPFLYEVVRHLFRWYMDEIDMERLAGVRDFPFWIRRLDVQLDEGDRSQVADIILPLAGVAARVKKADYGIEELGLEIRSRGFRIENVMRFDAPPTRPADCVEVVAAGPDITEYLFRTRAQAEFPDAAMLERLRVALRRHYGVDPNQREAGEHLVYLAPLSPVANELWVFIENKKLLVRFASDIDLENPAMWEHQSLAVRTYDLLNQTVISLDETPGSNAFITRDQAGRALYNCVVLGRRLTVVNPE